MQLATLCYVRKDGHTLMLHRGKKPGDIHAGKWNGLGGKFEPGESPEQCVVREVYEESGLKIASPRLCGLLLFADFAGDDWYVFVFTAGDFSGELHESSEGDLQWIPDGGVLALPLWESDPVFLPWLKGDKFFSARFQYKGDRMLGYEATFYP